MQKMIAIAALIVELYGCRHYGVAEVDDNYMVDFMPNLIHIVCDTVRTGKFQPYVMEFSTYDATFNTSNPSGYFSPRLCRFELPEHEAPMSRLTYLVKEELTGDSIERFTSNSNPTWYHYCYKLNQALLNKTILRINSLRSEQYSTVSTANEFVMVIISTMDSLPHRALNTCNHYLVDSLISKSDFIPIY